MSYMKYLVMLWMIYPLYAMEIDDHDGRVTQTNQCYWSALRQDTKYDTLPSRQERLFMALRLGDTWIIQKYLRDGIILPMLNIGFKASVAVSMVVISYEFLEILVHLGKRLF